MGESDFSTKLKKDLEELFPGCYIEKNGTDFVQGVPDLTIYWGKYWAKLETKAGRRSKKQPNQPYYVDFFNRMSYAAFINPENKEVILRELQCAFEACEHSRHS